MNDWQMFRSFDSQGPAQAMQAWLESEGVPCRIEPRSLERGIEADFALLVQADLAHRARWILAQLQPSERELEFLATGQLHQKG